MKREKRQLDLAGIRHESFVQSFARACPEMAADYEHYSRTGETPADRERRARPPRTEGHDPDCTCELCFGKPRPAVSQ